MTVDRIKRLNELVRRELSSSLLHVGHGDEIEVSRISIVEVDISRDLRSAGVLVSIMGSAEQADEIMKWLRSNRVELQSRIAKGVSLKYTPRLVFKQTQSIARGDRVLGILSELDIDEEN
ncbi:MAG: 30S ribosome-binding factor RbfA [Lentisphaerae bacterium]|jgi:ribosome-binding factor A|nr:30S ribosome-binding factor RbfA [Lentisphaerota bacterium]